VTDVALGALAAHLKRIFRPGRAEFTIHDDILTRDAMLFSEVMPLHIRHETSGEPSMNANAKQVIRVAVLGSPQAERWLLVQAFAATRKRPCSYELVGDPVSQLPDLYVIDPDNDYALARWAVLDAKGSAPAAFFRRVHPRAKCAVIVDRPLTSGRVVASLDQLARRFFAVSPEYGGRDAVQAGNLAPAIA
jgi:hypothetical protein